MPEVGCCILARPTRKMGLFRQMIGRILRPAPGKKDAIVLDHSGAVFRHGFVEDPVEWTLDPDRHAESPAHTKRCENYASRLLECTQCGAIRVGGEPCPSCGFLPQRPPRAVVFADGELAEVGRNRTTTANVYDPATRAQWLGMLTAIAAERGYKPGWAACQLQREIRELAALRRRRHADPAIARGAIVGALASDRLRQSPGRQHETAHHSPSQAQQDRTVRQGNAGDLGRTGLARDVTWRPQPIHRAQTPTAETTSATTEKSSCRNVRPQMELGSNRRYVARWFRELEYYGFIVMTRRGFLGIEGRGKAPHWRLTELAYKNDPPTRDFLSWNGIPFQAQKTRVSWKSGTVVPWKSVTPKNKPCPERRQLKTAASLDKMKD